MLIGGWFFAETHRLSGSLRLACLEHLLYGALIFTVALGRFIYRDAVRWPRAKDAQPTSTDAERL
ncbi:MAG: hypothetical protein KGJ37_04695 [Verrucomicrobiota bacterium]|nr:hypothetical protein [Verrucomicrobiota bacterium]